MALDRETWDECLELATFCYNTVPHKGHQLDNSWYKMLPMPIIREEPEMLKPQSIPSWKYMCLEKLAIGGIYEEKDLNRLRDMILFPIEKPTVLNKVALGIIGKRGNQEGSAITNMFDEQAIEILAKNI